MLSSCNAESFPVEMDESGMSRVYHTSGGSTDDIDAVSTTWSGCLMPTFTVNGQSCIYYHLSPHQIDIKAKKGREYNL